MELSEKVTRGHTENALKCKCNGGTIAFGLTLDKEHHYIPDPLTAPIVLEVYQRYAAGETLKQLVDDLDRRQIKGVKGNKIGIDTLNRILSNRKYIGEYKYHDIVVPDGIPAIVPEDLFNEVQEMKAKNKKAPARRKAEDLYILATKLFCGRCGTAMDGECGHSANGNRYSYYKCLSAKRKWGCKKRAVKKDWMENIVIAEAVQKLWDDEIIDQIADAVLEFQSQDNTTIPILNAQLKEVEKAIDNIMNAIQAGMFHSSMKKRMDDLENQKSEIETRILQEQISRPSYTKEQIIFWLKSLREYDVKELDQRQRLVDCFIKAVYLFDDHILITFNYSDDEKNISLSANEQTEALKLQTCSDFSVVGEPTRNI